MLHKTVQELVERAQAQGSGIGALVLADSAACEECSPDALMGRMKASLAVMKEARESGLRPGLRSESGLVGGNAHRLHRRVLEGRLFSGSFLGRVLAGALAVSESNACMGKIVAAPTAGSCGIIPACFLALQDELGLDDDALVLALFHAAGIGSVIAQQASISGAEGGCQAECGAAAGMAASALVELMGGAPLWSAHACAHALKSLMGLVCDPVAGLVEEPCVIRNASSAAVAVSAAELALAGVPSVIPVDQVIVAMGRVGRMMPACLRETAQGGIAATDKAREIKARLQSDKKII